MLFNSIDFAVFLPIVFLIYWFLLGKSLQLQNLFLLAASYVFYGWWDWRFLSLIAFSSIIDYGVALKLQSIQKQKIRKTWLMVSIFTNLGLLGFFKYYNFFLDSIVQGFTFFGQPLDANRLNIVLPVGISFYTFQTLSYTIDVYRNRLPACSNLITFMGYVSFFPQLVAGPIERATNLLPQFERKRIFDGEFAKHGFNQMVYGLFKKIVIADSCAVYADEIFANYSQYSSPVLFLGILYFSVQIYADFSGYSDIALGISKMFGFQLMINFKMPNFSRDVAEYWRRWHISLSTWFKDYLYIPLGGSKGAKWMIFRNTMLVFLISGLWHGASWNFVIWGGLNGLLFLPLILTKNNRIHMDTVAEGRTLPSLKEFWQISVTFLLITFTRIFFRSETLDQATAYAGNMFSLHWNNQWSLEGIERFVFEIIPLIVFFKVYEWTKRHKQHEMISNWWEMTLILLLLLIFGVYNGGQNFIYFQF